MYSSFRRGRKENDMFGITAFREVKFDDELASARNLLRKTFGKSVRPWLPKSDVRTRVLLLNKSETSRVVEESNTRNGTNLTASHIAKYFKSNMPYTLMNPLEVATNSFRARMSGGYDPEGLIYLSTSEEYARAIGRPVLTELIDKAIGQEHSWRHLTDVLIPVAKVADPILIENINGFMSNYSFEIPLTAVEVHHTRPRTFHS